MDGGNDFYRQNKSTYKDILFLVDFVSYFFIRLSRNISKKYIKFRFTIHYVLKMLDSFMREPTHFWNKFYLDRKKGIPFFVNSPDENFVGYFKNNLLKSGKVLELGCGPGRNVIFLAKKGCTVDAVDLSRETIKWARERAIERDVNVNFIEANIFDLEIDEEVYDIVYDFGCFHHIAPHIRISI